ncbi:MAG TPA: hypothetical protein VGK87_09225, partial [Anaerolineae bacterium]
MNYIFDARVIQDHFPGIGRYAYNLLQHLPDELQENECITALVDDSAQSSYLKPRRIKNERIIFINAGRPIFSARNLFGYGATAHLAADLYHFTYYVRPYGVGKPTVTTLYDAISHVYPQLVPSAPARIMIHLL